MKSMTLALLGISLVMAGCNLPGAGNRPSLGTQSVATLASASALMRTIDVMVNAPSSLAGADGKLVSGDMAGIIAAGSGNIIAAGSGNIIAAGSGNIIAAGSGNFASRGGSGYRVAAAIDAYRPVAKAYVQFKTLDGKRFGNIITSDDTGRIHALNVPDGKPLVASATFKVGAKIYHMAVTVNAGSVPMVLYADPINTMVEARVRKIAAASNKPLSPLTFDRLKEVWGYCNEAGVQIDPDKLQMNDAQDNDLAALDVIWQDAIDNQVANLDRDKPAVDANQAPFKRTDKIKALMAELKAMVSGS